MCARCIEIDDRTDRYRELAEYVKDQAAREAIARLIANLEVEKLGLHPEPDRRLGEGPGSVHGQDEA
jgi:putative component of toxin-antitoxin plasmid stabilization module